MSKEILLIREIEEICKEDIKSGYKVILIKTIIEAWRDA